ncbi:MAG: NYN domain-containing protein [Gemmataceae bacterium]|nr:NYN domain-containing protein [Gemmataceae bacterium]
MPDKVCIFWDNSNIFIPAKFVATKREGGFSDKDIRIEFDNMLKLARAGREIDRALCVGSVPPELEHVWERLRSTGVEVELYERGEGSGKEQGVDQCLQVHMLRALADVRPPAVAVLLTGDGAGYDTGVGYHADLERMSKTGWGIEVISWDCACNKKLKAWAQTAGVYIPLENFYDSCTFREGGRRIKPLNLKSRGLSVPKRPHGEAE